MSRSSAAQRRRIALYRFQVIATLLPPQLSRSERAERLKQLLLAPPPAADGQPAPALSRRKVLRWLSAYRSALGQSDPLQALEPKVRKDRGRSRKVPPELLSQVIALRERAARLSAKELLKRIEHAQKGQVARRTVARAMREAGYDRRDKRARIAARRKGPGFTPDWDLEAWEADFPNEVWQVDSTPSIWLAKGPHREQAVQLQLVNIIDDHSRRIVGGGFVERLRVTELLELLVPALARYGCPVLLYVDQAQIHRSKVLVEGLPRLGGNVVLGTAGHAPGHGKVERLHQKAEDTLVEDLRLSPVQTAEEATRYHQRWREAEADEVHTETGETPRSRWERILGNVRLPGADELLWAFRGEIERTVSELGAIRNNGRVYKAPPSHRRATPYKVTIRFDLLDTSQVWIQDEDGTRHPCALYRKLSHTERRARRDVKRPQISFTSLFEPDSSPADEEPEDLAST